jgi:hypothetical protein
MLVIWLGAGLFIAGILLLAAQPIWRDRLSGKRSQSAPPSNGTLEPPRPDAGFGLWSNWPDLVLIVLGIILMLGGAII